MTIGMRIETTKHSISHIRGVDFRKIVVRSKSEVGPTSDHCEENITGATSGMLDDGQPSSSKDDTICGAKDQWHNSDKGNARFDGSDQTLNNSLMREARVKDGANGSMEIGG